MAAFLIGDLRRRLERLEQRLASYDRTRDYRFAGERTDADATPGRTSCAPTSATNSHSPTTASRTEPLISGSLTFSPAVAVLLVLIGFAVGAFGTIVGSGGGFILAPILLVLYPHEKPATLTAISLTAVFFNAASGSAAYAHQRRIDYRSGLAFAAAALPGSIVGALVVGSVSRALFDILMAAVLCALAAWLLLGEPGAAHGDTRTTRQASAHRPLRPNVPLRGAARRGIAYSSVVGFVSSFLGIGGGIIHVPLLVRVLGFPTHIATATSHFVLAIIAGSGAATHGSPAASLTATASDER